MARNLRSRGRGRGKDPMVYDAMDFDYSPEDVGMQASPPEATASLPKTTRPVRTRSHSSSYAISTEESPFWTDPSLREPVPDSSAFPASSSLKQPMAFKFRNDHVGQPPGYVRGSAPLIRETMEGRWPDGVLSGGALIQMLEDLSRSSKTEDWQICVWLDGFAARFGRFHNSDGLIVTDAHEMYMLMLARQLWVGHKSEFAGGDIFWIPGLEPKAITDLNWEADARLSLPELPYKHYQQPWLAAENQYMHRVMERPQKGEAVYKGWVDGMKRERDIREGENIDQSMPNYDPLASTSNP